MDTGFFSTEAVMEMASKFEVKKRIMNHERQKEARKKEGIRGEGYLALMFF